MKLDVQDSIERPRKFPTYLVTRYPVGVDPSLAKELPGVYSVRRFHQHGTPINRLVIIWSLPHPPPPEYCFSFLPCLPPCEFRRMKDEQPWCFKCLGVGHISRYCSAPSDKCGWCAGTHSSRTCPHRTPSPPTTTNDASTSDQPPTPTPDTSMWKCPRCHEPGVNVWHGCMKRSSVATSQDADAKLYASSVPPPPPLQPLPGAVPPQPASTLSDSPQVIALREAVAKLTTRCTAIAARFDAIEARIDSLAAQQASTERTLASLVESQQVVIATVATFSEKLEVLTNWFEKFSNQATKKPPQHSPQRATTSTSLSPPASRKPKGRFQ